MFSKLFGWVCNCFSRPPRAGSDPNDRCNREAGGYGENPMQGLGCTEPPIGPDGDLPVVDPPQCYGGVGPCDPMPTLYRVAFPCKVPGSTCQTEGYPGGGGGECPPCCPPMCVSFAGYSVGDCVRPPEDRGLIEIKLENCTKCGWYTLSDQLRITIVPPTTGPTGNPNWTLDITLFCGDPLDWPVGHYESETFECGETSFAIVSATNSEIGDWQSSVSVFPCDGSGTGPATPPPTTCPEGQAMGMYVVPTGPAPLFPPFQDCPTCWIIDPSGIDTAFGDETLNDACCQNLNGESTLCYSAASSQGGVRSWSTPCTVRQPDPQPDPTGTCGLCMPDNPCYVAHWPGWDVSGMDCSNKDFQGWIIDPTEPQDFIMRFIGGSSISFTCSWSTPDHNGPGDQTAGFDLDSATSTLLSFQIRFPFHTTSGISQFTALYGTSEWTCDGATLSFVSGGVPGDQCADQPAFPSTIVIEPSPCADISRCGPGKYDSQRSKWKLDYDTDTQDWLLYSYSKIKTPKYTLHDETPCVGNTKVLTKVDDGDSGCSTAPDTITLTRGTDTQCMDCNSYVEPGCQVQLVRQCGSDGYALRHTSVVSANPKLSHICAQTRGNHIKQCCDVGCNYTPDTAPDPPCCSIQKVMYSANNDPWFDAGGSVEVWKLDLDASPIQLIGTFFEGVIVYEVDSNGLQCGKTPTQLYRSNDLTTLPDDLKQLYPTNVCMVGDMLKTCNVRYMTPEQEGVDQNFLGGPCNSAGYDPETGHEDFCACNDSCAPVIAGSIVTGANGECVSIVCASRIVAPQQDPDAKSKYSYVACATIWNEGNSQYDVLVQVMYCVGPGARWASDWYCTIGDPDATGPLTPRVCAPCSVYLGDFLGTTYADRDECGTLPAFGPPTDRPPGYSGCVCGTPDPCCGGPVSFGGTVPNVISATITSDCPGCDGTTMEIAYSPDVGSEGEPGGNFTWLGPDIGGIICDYNPAAASARWSILTPLSICGSTTILVYSGTFEQISCDPFHLRLTAVTDISSSPCSLANVVIDFTG